jgi:hypothetical protein
MFNSQTHTGPKRAETHHSYASYMSPEYDIRARDTVDVGIHPGAYQQSLVPCIVVGTLSASPALKIDF